ncbi:hypothetical protein PI124_g23973 [Phytophthora idaei]|nr:hypothetical protein PI125_g26223 [Phytophthora idaei]KAG3230930.1 hypothetical protein PI124_g23973 [Phytophthora idaei]
MSSSSDSDDNRRKSKKDKFHINSHGNTVHWDRENWPFYKKSMAVAFQKSVLEQIAIGKVKEDVNWSQDEKDEHTKKQAKIQMLIMASLTMRLAQPLMDQKTGTDMWAELCKIYEGRNNDATKAQKVYRLQGELHRTHRRANGDVRGHLYAMFRIKNELEELGSPLSDLQMVDMLLRSLPTQVCYNELRRKVLFDSNMSKYTPALVRGMILTAETRSKDWEKNAFGTTKARRSKSVLRLARKAATIRILVIHQGRRCRGSTSSATIVVVRAITRAIAPTWRRNRVR